MKILNDECTLHVFQSSHPRRALVDKSGHTWFVTKHRCRRCGYVDFEYQVFDLREKEVRPKSRNKPKRQLTPQEQRKARLRRAFRKFSL